MRFKHTLLGLLVAAGMASGATVSHAEGLLPGAAFSVDCQNGAVYKLTSGRVTFPGDIVTGHLYLTPHRAMPVRLIPMGEGYRYAGRGVWLDGIREHALCIGPSIARSRASLPASRLLSYQLSPDRDSSPAIAGCGICAAC